MSDFKGTPGPWFVGCFGGVNGSGNFVGANPSRDGCYQICTMTYSKYIPDNEVDANGALIAAAPELLEALQEMVAIVKKNTYPQPDKPSSTWGRMQAAEVVIARALGQ